MDPTSLGRSAGIVHRSDWGFLPPTRLYTQDPQDPVGTVDRILRAHSDQGPQADTTEPTRGNELRWYLMASWVGGSGGLVWLSPPP